MEKANNSFCKYSSIENETILQIELENKPATEEENTKFIGKGSENSNEDREEDEDESQSEDEDDEDEDDDDDDDVKQLLYPINELTTSQHTDTEDKNLEESNESISICNKSEDESEDKKLEETNESKSDSNNKSEDESEDKKLEETNGSKSECKKSGEESDSYSEESFCSGSEEDFSLSRRSSLCSSVLEPDKCFEGDKVKKEEEVKQQQEHRSTLLRKRSSNVWCGRKNMTFNDTQLRKIERENQLLLRKIMAQQIPKPNFVKKSSSGMQLQKRESTSAVNRKRLQRKIEEENMLLLKRIQQAKPVALSHCRSTPGFRSTFL